MKLIREFVNHADLEIITEGIDNGRVLKIKGPFLSAETKNKNGRIYSKELIEREVYRYNRDKIEKGRSVGTLDHDPSPTVALDRVSHLIESLQMDGKYAIGVAKILETPMGNVAKSLINSGVSLGVSSRGVGTLSGSNVNMDYKMICIDIVGEPSGHGCFVEGILENKEYIIQNNEIVEVAVHNLEKDLNKNGSRHIKYALDNFLMELKQNL